MTNKQTLRAAVKARKRAMTREDIARRSEELCKLIQTTDAYKSASAIYGYLPFNQEIDLRPLLRQAMQEGKQVALPKCHGQTMQFILTTDLDAIQYSPLGAPEPVAEEPAAREETALVIVPGLVFDRRGYRIGYGGGFYDRFLAAEPNHPTMALCYDFQLVDCIDPEPHDVPVDAVYAR